MRPLEQIPSDLVSILERALCVLDGSFLLDHSAADHTWLEAARTDLRASIELMRREPVQIDAWTSAAELTAKAGLCLASLPMAHREAAICEAAGLIAMAHVALVERRTRHVMADAVVAE